MFTPRLARDGAVGAYVFRREEFPAAFKRLRGQRHWEQDEQHHERLEDPHGGGFYPYPRGCAPRTPPHALSRAAASARSVSRGSLARLARDVVPASGL